MADQKGKKSKVENPRNQNDSISTLLGSMEANFQQQVEKASFADYVRLTQLERELVEDRGPGMVVCKWDESTIMLPADE